MRGRRGRRSSLIIAKNALSADTLMALLAAGHGMEAVARAEGDGKGVSFDQLSKLFVLGVQEKDTPEALGAALDKHIAKLEGSRSEAAAPAAGDQPGAQV